ncbi:SDR family NAD(P)-dependent oxidoreductase [Peribacillus glennii]|nr:SDR family NAD(P)-dependent oxidoreductase [Peribacillus glennii]
MSERMVKALENVHVVITGASDGLGYAMAEALLDKGAKVAVSYPVQGQN